MQRLRANLGPVGSDVLTTRHIGQINDKHRAHIKTKKALCYIEKNKKTTGTVLLKKTPQDTLSKLIPKEKYTGNKNVMYAFKWYFYGFLYNTTFSENIHLDINSSTNVQNL